MRIDFIDKVRHNLFLRYTLIDDRTYLREDLLNQILNECALYKDKTQNEADHRAHFVGVCQQLTQLGQDGFSKLIDVNCDFLYWYQVQNLFHDYFKGLPKECVPDLAVLRALKQMITKSVYVEYFALTDVSLCLTLQDLMLLIQNHQDKDLSSGGFVLTEVFAILDELQENLTEQKTQLRFIDNTEIQLNSTLLSASLSIGTLLTTVLKNFQKCLTWYIHPEAAPSTIELEIKAEFQVVKVTNKLIEFVFCAFKTLLRDRPFGYTYCPTNFVQQVNPVVTVLNLCKIVKNEGNLYKIEFVLHALQILDGLTCIDLIKEFKDLNDKRNPYFKEACKQFNLYAEILRCLAYANQSEMQVDSSHHSSQRFLFNYLLFLQDIVELKTREMSTSLYVQIVEPLVHLIAEIPVNGFYKVDLICQEAALLILKTITKRSHIFNDSTLLVKIIDRLKVELQILQEDLTGEPNRWKTLKPENDLEFNSYTLEKRQKFVKDLLGFLCYSIIRMDPTQINQQNNFVPYSRKILESCLFEECLMDFVFLKNTNPPIPFYEKVVDPIFMDCVQLYTFLGNDLPQKLGELIDNQMMLCILQSLDRRIPIQSNMLSVVIKFFKMLNLNAQGTEVLLGSNAIERFFETSLDYRSYKLLVMPKGTTLMFDQRQIIHSFANEHQEIANRIYAQCIKNIVILQQKGWTLSAEFLKMQNALKTCQTELQKVALQQTYGKKQINFEQTLEASVALLSCFCMDEIEYIDNLSTYSSFVLTAIKANKIDEQLYKLLRTPIICSAADAFIYHFQESATFILIMQGGIDGFQQHLEQLQKFLQQSFQDLYTILGASDLDTLSTIEVKAWTDLAEPDATEEQRESLKQLIDEDVAWVAIGKIHVLIEMVIILGTLSKFHQAFGIYQHYQNFIDQLLAAPVGGIQCIAKLQSLLHRYYANVYVDCVKAQESRRISLLSKYESELKNYVWTGFRESEEPYCELEDARNVYFRYQLQTVESLLDKRAEDLTKTQFEFVLQESKGVIQTFKCYKKIKNLMSQLATNYNKRRFQFKDKLLPQQIAFNTMSAGLISEQLKLILHNCTANGYSIDQSLKTALLIDRILPDLSKLINNKWKNQVNGTYLLTLLKEEKIVVVVGSILKWAVEQYNHLEQQPGLKCLFHARNLQIIVRECVQFYLSLLKLTYLCSGNMQTYLAYFRRDQSQVLNKQMVQSLFPTCFTLTKNCLLKTILLPINHILFQDNYMSNSWHFFTGSIQENILKIYQTLCQGSFKEPIDFFGDQSIQSSVYTDNQPLRYHPLLQPRRLLNGAPLDEEDAMMVETNEQYVNQLVLMGFTDASSRAVLRHYGNDFEFALDALLRGEFKNVEPEAPKPQLEEQPAAQIDVSNALLYESEYGAQTELEICEQICSLIASTFIKCTTEAFASTAISNKRQLIMKVFQFYKDNINKPTQKTIQKLIINLSQQLQQCPSWFNVCFIVQLLAYIKEDWLSQVNLVGVFKSVIQDLKDQAQHVKEWTNCKVKTEDDLTEKINVKLYSLHVNLSVIYFMLLDFKANQDVHNVLKMCAPEDQDKSAFEETITHKDVEEIKEELQQLQGGLLQISDGDRLELAKLTYQAVIVLLQNFTNVEISIAANLKNAVQNMLGPCIKVLKVLSQLQDFDFRTTFIQDNGLKLLFDMSIVDSEFESKSYWESDKGRDGDIKELIENVWENPKDMQRWYEILIQRQMFFQFKANYKRLSAEGKLPKDNYEWIISGMELQQQKEEPGQDTATKKKQIPIVQQIKKNKSQNKQKHQEEETFVIPPQKDLKRICKKYEDLNEQDFTEFVKYYNSNIFQHVIVHFQVFLAACAKVCVIKKVLKPLKEGEESTEPQYKFKIMLKKQLLKDMLVDPNFNYGLPQKLPLKPQNKLEGITRTQQEIVNQMLEIFIAQTKGYRMDVLRQLREPQLSTDSVLEIRTDGKLTVKPLQDRRIYFLDQVQILRTLWTLNSRNNLVIGVIMKHNDSKTIKFIFRNIFYLTTLTIQDKEILINQNLPNERTVSIVGFFINIMLFNHGSNLQEKATKRELQQIFIRQLAKSLIQKQSSDTAWAISQTLLQKYSAVWLMARFLTMKGYESGTKDAFGAISQKKSKFQRLQRMHIVKQLILQCNQMQQQQPFESSSFVLLENIQSASLMLRNKSLYLFHNQRTQCLEVCVGVITRVLKLFESSQSLGKFFRSLEEQGSLRSAKSESSEYMYSNSDESDDFPDENMMEAAHSLAELMSDVDDDYEEGEEEEDYDQEYGEEEMKEEIIVQDEPPIQTQAKGPPPPEENSHSSNPSESVSQASLDSLSDSVEQEREQISFQEQESSYEQQDDEYGSVDDDQEEDFSLDDFQDEEGDEGTEPHRRVDRRAFILSQGPQRQVAIMRTDFVSLQQDLFDLDNGQSARLMGNFSPNLQRFIQQTPELTNEFSKILDINLNANSDIGGGFVENIQTAKTKLQQVNDRVKACEQFYLSKISIFTQSSIKPVASQTAESSETFHHNPDDFKTQISKPQLQLQIPKRAPNPLDIEGMDPLFMENLSAIGLQNIADSHQIHAQLTAPLNINQEFEVLQDLVWFLRSQPQSRRQDILRQVQYNQCRDLPSDLFAEMREMYQSNRDQFLRVMNQQQRPTRDPRPQQQPRASRIREVRAMSLDSNQVSIDLNGPQNSQPVQVDKVEQISCDQFIQNFFIILQDLNNRFENENSVVQTERQAESVLQSSLIPSLGETAQVQFQKIKGLVEVAQTAFMNLDLEKDQQLTQSIKILHRIPNIRICLILSVLKQGYDELQNAKQHCQNSLESCKPYESNLLFSSEQDIAPLFQSMLNVLKTTASLQTTIQAEQPNTEILEIVTPLCKDQLMQKFAQLIGLKELQSSIFESLLELMLDFLQLMHDYPWVIVQQQEAVIQEVHSQIIEFVSSILKPVLKQQYQGLPVLKLCEFLFSPLLLLTKKPLQLVGQMLNEIDSEIIFTFLRDQISHHLTTVNYSQLEHKIGRIFQVFKIAQSIQSLKQQNICEEQLLLAVFERSSQLVNADVQSQRGFTDKNVLFVFDDAVKSILHLIFCLCEYNLRLILSQKEKSPQELQINTVTTDPTIQNILEPHIQPHDINRFAAIIKFFIENKKLINKFIQMNSNVISKELVQVALMIPHVFDFDTKRIIWRADIKKKQYNYRNERFSFQVRRESVLEDSYQVLHNLSVKQWRGGMQVEFLNEEGVDGGGLFKEWISTISQEIFNEDRALFIKAASGSTYYPNPKSTVQPNFMEMFTFVGKIFGKALWDGQLLDCYFVKAFYKIMLGMPLSYNDLEDYDSELYKSLNWMIENQGVDAICSSFVETIEYFGESKEIELCEEGKDKMVTDENKLEYVQLVANYRLYKAISVQVDAFLKGLFTVVPKDLLKIFDNLELELLISGLQNIDIDDLRENTLYQNYTAQSKPVQFLFEALAEFDNLERSEFIRFVTGSSKVPIEGFRGLRGSNGIQKFTVVKIPSTTQTRLPQSHTCHNQLDLPEYKDKETTKRMLLMAIKEGKTFGFA